MRGLKYIYYVIVGLLLCTSCASHQEAGVVDAEYETICELKENIGLIGQPQVFDMADGESFVVTDWTNVYLYGIDGNQIKRIGTSGRGGFEYIRPSVVRTDGEFIWVWSSGTLAFIVYRKDGQPVEEYQYPSAIQDFEVSGNKIYIYTAGKRYGNVIDIYDTDTEEVVRTLTPTSKEHRFMLRKISASPMSMADGSLVYAAKDNMKLVKYDLKNDSLEEFEEIVSETFEIEPLTDTNMLFTNRNKAFEYYNENPMTILVSPDDEGYFVMTLEGKTRIEGDDIVQDDRYFGLYSTARRGDDKRIRNYSYGSIGTETLLDSYDNNIYFIRHSISENDDVYTLCRLIAR